ncbi:MAG: AEC family transporter [Lachnospiraceae bacterium]|nr:AEC family transporter [Lachnospiraceae bacterium]
MSFLVVLQQMGVICLLVAIGFYLNKKGVVDGLTSKKISAIVVDVTNPALIMASILSGNVTASHDDLIVAALLGITFYVIVILLGLILPRILRAAPDDRRFYNLMCVYTNIGFLGIPVARAILPENAIIYVVVCNVFYSLLFYTHGVTVLGGGKEKVNLKKIISPGTVMAVLSLAVFWFGIQLPPILSNTVQYIGNSTIFLSMMLLGVVIARSDLASSVKDIRIWVYIVLRMILIPIATFYIMQVLKFDPVATITMCLMTAMPVGNLPLIQAEKTGEKTEILSSAIALTTAVSIISITVLMSAFSVIL